MLIRRHRPNIKIFFIAYVLLLTGCAQNFNINENTGLDANTLATSQYYSELIAGASPKIAELTLFTNMLPKGGDLHHHYSGAIYAETYLDWIDKSQYCICHDPECKSNVDPETAAKFAIMKNPPAGACISAQDTRKDNAFYRDLLKHWSDKDFDNHFHEQTAPDQQFFNTFSFFGPVSNYSYHEGLALLKERAIAENVLYLETMLKSAPTLDHPTLAKRLNALNSSSTDQQIDEALNAYFEFMAQDPEAISSLNKFIKDHEAAAAGIDDAKFSLRFQAYVSRNSDPAKVFSSLYSAFAADKKSPLIVGVNIVGPENGYVAMRDYSLHMKMLKFLKQRFPEVRLALHAGELVLGMVPPEGLKNHINEAIRIASAQRIGHGMDIIHETDAYELLEIMKQRNIAVEINLSSNEFILGVKDEAHPLQLYRQYAVPFVISTDDAGVSRNNLSHEYLLFTSRYKPSYQELKSTVYNSIRYAFLSEDEKRNKILELDRRFSAFEAKIAMMANSRIVN